MVIPGQGVRKIVHGCPWGDEFPTWSFEVARCVFVYTYSRPSLPSLSRRGNILGTRMYGNKYITIYIFILIYVYKHVCMCVYMCVFIYKNIAGYYNKAFFFPLKKQYSKRE